MESAKSLCKKLLDVKNTVITDCVFYMDTDNVSYIRIKARPSKWHENECPYCHRRCSGYDSRCKKPRIWRGLDWGATLVEIEYQTHRIECPEHGVVVSDVPWAYPGSGFTKDFDLTVAWFAVHLPRSVVAEYFRMDWETVGRCVSRMVSLPTSPAALTSAPLTVTLPVSPASVLSAYPLIVPASAGTAEATEMLMFCEFLLSLLIYRKA